VALSTKGKFYEIEHTNMQMFSKNNNSSNSNNNNNSYKSKQLNMDCVHRISNIITDETTFPVTLKFISKHVNGQTLASIPGEAQKSFIHFIFLVLVFYFFFIHHHHHHHHEGNELVLLTSMFFFTFKKK
jgi:hypothetical protein